MNFVKLCKVDRRSDVCLVGKRSDCGDLVENLALVLHNHDRVPLRSYLCQGLTHLESACSSIVIGLQRGVPDFAALCMPKFSN